MKQEVIETGELSYSPCRYGNSKVLFRGPRKALNEPYLAFIGGTETYGKFIHKPFPALVEKAMRQPCVNLGCVNGGIDAVVKDTAVLEICRDADLTVIQIMGAHNLSNRFYSVHPRRNDRFLMASTVLQAIYPEVDFSQFSFTRHMLGALHDTSPERFDIVVNELRQAWLARMRSMVSKIGRNVILLWFSEQELNNQHWSMRPDHLKRDPLFVTASLIDELRPLVRGVVVVQPSHAAKTEGAKGMIHSASQHAMASEMLGVRSHYEASAVLVPAIREQLYTI